MKVQIKEPCPANWDKMQIKLHARHCDQCDKSVIDFTQKSRAEIITFLLENPNGSVCGRMNSQQFDILEEDLPELISIISQPRFRANAFLILAIVCSSLFQSCETTPTQTKPKDKPKIELKNNFPLGKIKVKDTVETPFSNTEKHKTNSLPIDIKGEVYISPVPEPEPKIAGGISYEPMPPYDEDEILSYAEVMPEFPGGMKEMLKFINQNLVYPQELIETDFSSRIFVQFVVTKTGEVEKVSIAKGIDSISGLNQAAIRLVKQMPKWTPGINKGKEVNVKMVIPIRFSIQ
jgi:TonB family protein